MAQSLGRKIPTDDKHIQKYPLRSSMIEGINPAPVCVGINWYAAFDNPVKDKDGTWWVGKNPASLGRLRGGHCVVMPHDSSDSYAWYNYYNQGREGACVGFGASRMMSLLNRKRYDARWLWNEAKVIDDWADTNPGDNEGTSVRAAMDILRTKGHIVNRTQFPQINEGISANRWATTIDQVFGVLQNKKYDQRGAIPFHNSWGKNYPHKVWAPGETWERLLKEWGEFTMITDR